MVIQRSAWRTKGCSWLYSNEYHPWNLLEKSTWCGINANYLRKVYLHEGNVYLHSVNNSREGINLRFMLKWLFSRYFYNYYFLGFLLLIIINDFYINKMPKHILVQIKRSIFFYIRKSIQLVAFIWLRPKRISFFFFFRLFSLIYSMLEKGFAM